MTHHRCAASALVSVLALGFVAGPVPASALDPIVLHFHGNPHDIGPNETACSGRGAADITLCEGPFLTRSAALDSTPAAYWEITSAQLDDASERSLFDPNWVWNLSGPTTISGLTTIRWWASCNATCKAVGGDWDISIWADGVRVFGPFQVTATPDQAEVPSKVKAQVTLPTITATRAIVLVIDAHYADTGQSARFYYDSAAACPGALTGPCDSTVVFNDIPEPPPPANSTLHFHGNPQDDPACTGSGQEDILACDGPYLSARSTLGTGAPGHWDPPSPALNGSNARTLYDPSWKTPPLTSNLDIAGSTLVQWWANCNGCGEGVANADWRIRVFTDFDSTTATSTTVLDQLVRAIPEKPGATDLLAAYVTIPAAVATKNLIVHVDPVFADSQQSTHIYYDSQSACPGFSGNLACDSFLRLKAPPLTMTGNACVLPGGTVVNDGTNDQSSAGSAAQDIQSISIAELGADTNMLTFTLKVASLSGTPPPNGNWHVYFVAPNNTRFWVGMDTSAAGAASFNYGTRGNAATGTGFAATDTTTGVADSGSFTPDGTIRIKIAKSKVGGPAVGAKFTQIFARTYLGAARVDAAPNATPSFVTYTLVGNPFCANQLPEITSFTPTPSSGPAPLDVSFTAAANDPDGTVASYTFDFGDGGAQVTQATATISHTYTGIGGSSTALGHAYTAKVRATDNLGAVGAWVETPIFVENLKPVAVLTANPETGESPQTVSFSGENSSDPDLGDGIANYVFNFGDGSPAVSQSTPDTSHPYPTRGNYIASLQVFDNHGLAGEVVTKLITVTPGPPQASFTLSQPTVLKGNPVTLDASASSADDLAGFAFDFHDGFVSDGSDQMATSPPDASATYTYMRKGVYAPEVTVTDTQGVVASVARSFTVTNTAPQASFTADPLSGQGPLTVNFDMSASSDPDFALTGDRVVSYDVDFRDGTVLTNQPTEGPLGSPVFTHEFHRPGTHTVRLTAYDVDGDPSGSVFQLDIDVINDAPVAVISADPGAAAAPAAITFDGSGSSDRNEGDGIYSYTFDFGDDSEPFTRVGGSTVRHVYAEPGTYTAQLVVQDSYGASSAPATINIVVGAVNRAPVARVSADPSAGIGPLTVTFDAGASADTDGDALVEYTFDFGDGTAPVKQAQSTAAHSYSTAGRYSAFVTVKDARGALSSNSDALTVTVTDAMAENTAVPAAKDEKGPFSGGLPPGSLLALGLLAVLRRRRRA